MSLKALPLQFFNLGGEMMYILNQRLQAQAVPIDRASKVRNDILMIMLSPRFVEELFHPQPLYSRSALRIVFDKLAHASIMRLNGSSMDKLFDLMMMALKQQLLLCRTPRDLLFITLNHIDSMYSFAVSAEAQRQVVVAQEYLMQMQQRISLSEWADIRKSLLMFVQDLNIRVSIFMKTGAQDSFGRIVLPTSGPVSAGCEVPGTIKFFDPSGRLSLMTLFPSGGSYLCADEPGSLDSRGIRGTTLGLNMYENKEDVPFLPSSTSEDNFASYLQKGNSDKELSGKGKEELNLLAQLIGSVSHVTSDAKGFKLNFFQNKDEDSDTSPIIRSDVILIEGSDRVNPTELGNIIGQLSMEEDPFHRDNSEENDLLDLLDSI